MTWFVGVLVMVTLLAACGGSPTAVAPSPSSVARLSAPLPSEVRQKGKVLVGVKCDYPPFGYTDESGHIVGYEIDMARRMALYAFGSADAMELQCVVAANRVPFLTTGRIDLIIATLTYTPERAQTIAFSDPYFEAAGRMLVPRSSSIKEARDLAGKTVTTIRGGIYETYLHDCVPGATVLTFDQTSDALQALQEGRAQAFMHDDTLLVGLARTSPGFKMVGSGVAAGPWGIGLRLEDEALLAWVNAALAEMQKEDFNWRNFRRWLPDATSQRQFAKAVPRPGQSLQYGQGPVTACVA